MPADTPKPATAREKPSQYRPLNAKRRLVLGVLAVAMAITVVMTLLHPPGGVKRVRHVPADSPRCAPNALAAEASDCVGGRVDVIVPSASAVASGTGR